MIISPNITKNSLIDGLHKILSSKTANNRFYGARCRGFRSEIELVTKAREQGWNLLDGGQCLFTRIDWPTSKENRIIYVTVSSNTPERYTSFYNSLSRLSIFRGGFFISIGELNNWSNIDIGFKNTNGQNRVAAIPKPEFNVSKFVNGHFEQSQLTEIVRLFPTINSAERICQDKPREALNYLVNYDISEIADIYANRFFLDVTLGRVKKGMIDFDGIINDNENFTVIETKEKDVLKVGTNRADWLFGWDSRRLSWYLYLKDQLGLNSTYIIREVDNQTERRLVAWKRISLSEFCECASWLSEHSGGGGSGTITAPYLKFNEF